EGPFQHLEGYWRFEPLRAAASKVSLDMEFEFSNHLVRMAIEPVFKQKGISYELYTGVVPNPTVDNIDTAVKMGKDHGSQAVIGIGGGSPIDVAKSVAVLLKNTDKTARELYELTFEPDQAVPIIAINTTHGTGTEVDRFAVASIPEKNYKPAIAYDCIYPLFAIDDPMLMMKLPPNQTRYVSVDAVNHITEAATSLATSPYVILTAQETVRLVAKYLPQAIDNPEDLTARYYLLYASAIAGICFDNGLLHFTHAMEHPLSAIKPELPHGLGLAMLLPAVVKQIYPAVPEILAAIYQPIVPGLKGIASESGQCAAGIEEWLFSVGIKSKLQDEGYTKQDVDKLTNLVLTTPSLDTLLSVAPIEATEQTIRSIYEDSFKTIK
ncbi:MAG TPA: iron-containing alcohol dehydrogenase, partial [Syntrophomonas sp.]|nr:iron-containing alcohol dehydrogenase [Syntrophomonas sp.]